jgi:hypothetical protein
MNHDLQGLGKALSSGNLVSAQKALNRFYADLQDLRPPQNGLRISAGASMQGTLRSDAQGLQAALDSGDLALAEEAFVRLQEDAQQATAIAASQGAQASISTAALAVSAASNNEEPGLHADSSRPEDQGAGKSIDTYA